MVKEYIIGTRIWIDVFLFNLNILYDTYARVPINFFVELRSSTFTLVFYSQH